MADSSRKRKQPSDAHPHAKRPRFPHRPQHHIPAQPTKTAYPDGEVNVNHFLASHQNEIKALEGAMRAAKKGLARRAFQDVPRELRRRTASHNPQRVPKRLRARARQEASEDNTPITRGTSGSGVGKGRKKFLRKEGRERSRLAGEARAQSKNQKSSEEGRNGATEKQAQPTPRPKSKPKPKPKSRFPALATPATPASRFRRRQRDKTWLPTHVWHTKRSRMTDPKAPLWRFAIPLAPAVKAYRLTHRAASQRGAVAWDMSYMSTISLEGAEASISALLKGLHFAAEEAEDPWQGRGKGKKWRHGTRVWEGWIHEREAKPLKKMARVAVVWRAPDTDDSKRKALVRVHPSAFLQLWNEMVRIAKVQRPTVTVQDLRFEIGSIEVVGPAAAEALCSVLSPITSADAAPDAPHSLWSTLAPVTDVSSMPAGALLAFEISDPRLRDPPAGSQIPQDEQSLQSLTEILAQWPIDNAQTPSSIFDRNSRLAAARLMPSQKSINRRKAAETLGGYPEARPTDPRIPMLLYVSRESKSWTIMLPWKCVLPVWRGIMRYPVSTGGNPRFGGLKERRQVNFERSVPSFPYDYPGTDAGWTWEMQEREARKHEWTKRPKGKRIEWSTIDLGGGRKGETGDPWACDWERLLLRSDGGPGSQNKPDEAHSAFRQLPSQQIPALITGTSSPSDYLQSLCLFTVKITMVQRGTTADCARVYRLPTNNTELRKKWLSLLPGPGPSSKSKGGVRKQTRITNNAPEHVQRRELANQLLQPAKAGEDEYPLVPDEEDLIGFVTTGNYNLAEGMSTAVANLVLHRVIGNVGNESEGRDAQKERHVCIVREPGRTIGRLATWEVV